MNHEQLMASLRTAAIAHFPTECDIDDIVQEALTAAIASGASPDAMLDAASTHLRELRTRRYWDRRRIPQVPLQQIHETKPPPTPGRRNQSRNRRPAGVLGTKTRRGVAIVTLDESVEPTMEVQLAAHILATVDLMRVAYGEPYSRKAEQLILALHAELYGVKSPRDHWAAVLLDTIEEAKLQLLKSRDPAQRDPITETPSVTFRRKKPKLGQDKETTLALEAESHQTVPGRGVINYYTTVDGKRIRVSTVICAQRPLYPADPVARAEAILMRTRVHLTAMEGPLRLPDYIDDTLLVRWLFVRAGFAGGGGPDAVKRSTLLNWLQNPEKLASQVAAYAKRRLEGDATDHAQPFEDEREDEPTLEEALTELAARIRLRVG